MHFYQNKLYITFSLFTAISIPIFFPRCLLAGQVFNVVEYIRSHKRLEQDISEFMAQNRLTQYDSCYLSKEEKDISTIVNDKGLLRVRFAVKDIDLGSIVQKKNAVAVINITEKANIDSFDEFKKYVLDSYVGHSFKIEKFINSSHSGEIIYYARTRYNSWGIQVSYYKDADRFLQTLSVCFGYPYKN